MPTSEPSPGSAGDSPAWIDEGDGTRTRYVTGPDGNLAAAVTATGTTVTGVRYQLVGLHDDVITTTSPGAATPDGAFLDYNEFGSLRGTTPAVRYGWLGGKQRSADTLAGLTLMGVRVYAPTLGRFLQVDPVAAGGANDYDYAYQDPQNKFDPSGEYTNGQCDDGLIICAAWCRKWYRRCLATFAYYPPGQAWCHYAWIACNGACKTRYWLCRHGKITPYRSTHYAAQAATNYFRYYLTYISSCY